MFEACPLAAIFALIFCVFSLCSAADLPPNEYGRSLPIVSTLDIGPCIDMATSGRLGCAIGQGRLICLDLKEPLKPVITGTVGNLGDVRQVALSGSRAFVTARIDGLFLVDVSDPTAPRVVSHYDTIEKATGLAVEGDIVYVACRYYGVEIIDFSQPQEPRHLATVMNGKEVQSVAVRDGWLYGGIWADCELGVADVRNPLAPQVTAFLPMDGYGDGVFVHGKYCLAATGHHSRAYKRQHFETPQAGDQGFGLGHGLEILALDAPGRPRPVSRLKCPQLYMGIPDFWSVEAQGDYAFLADTFNGVFVVDLKDPARPVFAGHCRLPEVEFWNRKLSGAVGGVALGDDCLYVAGVMTGLHVVDAKGFCRAAPAQSATAGRSGQPLPRRPEIYTEDGAVVYRPGGQVRMVRPLAAEVVAVAAGQAGIALLQVKPEVKVLSRQRTPGIARHLSAVGRRLYVAEANAGLSIWEVDENWNLRPIGRLLEGAEPILQVETPAPGRYALVEIGIYDFAILDLADPVRPRQVLRTKGPGIFYGPQIMAGLIQERYAAVYWHTGGPYWFDLAAPDGPRPVGDFKPNIHSGASGLTPMGEQALVLRNNGYVLLSPQEKRELKDLPLAKVAGENINGVASLQGETLYVSNPAWQLVRAVNVKDPAGPTLISKANTHGNPGPVVVMQDLRLVPNGYEGLRIETIK